MRMMALYGATLLFISAVPAEAAKVRFEGHFLITKAAGTCTDYDPKGSLGSVQFEPEVAGSDNGPGSSFGLFDTLGAKGYRLSSGTGLFDAGFKPVDTMYMGSDFGPDGTASVLARFKTQKPLTIKTTTHFLTVTAEIQNFDFMVGCTVTIDMPMTRRLN
jgi:hypothetical protein